MTRREWMSLAAAAPLAGASRYRDYSRVVPDHFVRLAERAKARRDAALAKLTTPEAVAARQDWVRTNFWQLIGGKPERTPLNVRTTGSLQRQGFRIEKLVYESQPGLIIPANLYIPAGTGPFPGILFQLGHSLNGKAEISYQKCCQGLARLGYLVLAFDPMGQGERTYYPKPGGVLTRLRSADDEHTVPGKQMLLVGDSATRMQTWDAVRSLDVLASHPLVDPKRLASTGQSGGGTTTMFLAAVDQRLAAAAVSSGNTENFACADFNPPGSVDDAEQNLVGSGTIGLDRWDLLLPVVPKPMLVSVSDRDFFGTYSPRYIIDNSQEFTRLSQMYGVFKKAELLSAYGTPLPHGLSHDMRIRVYRFFDQHFLQLTGRPDPEQNMQVERDEDLWAGKTGNVVRDFGSKTPLRLTQERAAGLRGKASNQIKPIPFPATRPALTSLGFADAEAGVTIEAVEFESEPGIFLPAWFYRPKETDRQKPVLILLDSEGRAAHWREGGMLHTLANAGSPVFAVDLRGIGDLAPEVSRGNPHYALSHAKEDSYAWAALILGVPLYAQRVSDILAIVQSVRAHESSKGRRVVLAAKERLTVPALLAAGMMKADVDTVYLSGGLTSFASLLEQEEYRESFANFIPGILARTDIPEIDRMLGSKLKRGTGWDAASLAAL